MNVMELINAYRGSQGAPQAPQQGGQASGGTFLEGLLDGSHSGAPGGFSMPFPNVMGQEGNKYYPEFRFGWSGTPALERLGVTQPGGLPPGMAMQLAKSQYFAPGTGQGVNMAGGTRGGQQPAPSGPAGGEWVTWAPGMGAYFSPFQTQQGQSIADAYLKKQMQMSDTGVRR